MTDPLKILPYSKPCPKCTIPFAQVKWCRTCDDVADADHLHRTCTACGYVRLTRCADAAVDGETRVELPLDGIDEAQLRKAADKLAERGLAGEGDFVVPVRLLSWIAGEVKKRSAVGGGGA